MRRFPGNGTISEDLARIFGYVVLIALALALCFVVGAVAADFYLWAAEALS